MWRPLPESGWGPHVRWPEPVARVTLAVMAEPVQTVVSPPQAQETRLSDTEEAPLDPADFPGCKAVRIPCDDIEDYDGRLEYREARTETAIVVCEPTTIYHEWPSQRLAGLARLIAASRGSPIEIFGASDLVRFESGGKRKVLMQADQILYLDPLEVLGLGPGVDVDGDKLPDVTVEVDYSTDVRVRKLRLSEAWGFPEVWVDVPDERSRPRSRHPGLTIHVLEDDRYRTVSASRTFPG